MVQTVQQRATVVAKCRRCVRVRTELVFAVWSIRVHARVHTRTHERHEFVASFVDDERADLALKALSPEAPNKVLAVAAKGRLLEESRYELVLFDFDHELLAKSTAPSELLELRVVLRVTMLVAVVRELTAQRVVVVAVGRDRVGVTRRRAHSLEGR